MNRTYTQAHSIDGTGKAPGLATNGRQRNISQFGQIVLALQGGGALGAYQAGVYQALHEAGVEPDWVIGTSIGAINASLIAGNKPEHRLAILEPRWTQSGARGYRECPRDRPRLVKLDDIDDRNTGFLQTESVGVYGASRSIAG